MTYVVVSINHDICYREIQTSQVYEGQTSTIPKQHIPNGGPGRPMSQSPGDGRNSNLYMNGNGSTSEAVGAASPPPNTTSTLPPPGSRPPRRPSNMPMNQENQLVPASTTPNTQIRQSSQEPVPGGPPKGPPRRKLTRDELMALRRKDGGKDAPKTSEKDCFMISQANLERFLPDGITVITHIMMAMILEKLSKL